MKMEEFRDQLLKYLFVEKRLIEEENEANRHLSIQEKVEKSLILIGCTIVQHVDDTYVLNVPDNYSKLRAGDKVYVAEEGKAEKSDATILDVFFDSITISCARNLDTAATFTLEMNSPVLLQSLISCLEGIYSGVPGASFLRLLSGEEPFEIDDFMEVKIEDVPNFDAIRNTLNDEQLSAVRGMLQYPPIHVLQGPPGTGKTNVLAATAIATARMNREVVVIANTHQAVNNALQKIRTLDKNATLIKVGTTIKAEELDDSFLKYEKFSEYYEYSYNNRRKKRTGHIIGMTIWGAVAYLGLRHHAHFRPYQALVDEASLMPLSLATILGKCAPSVCLFGDSRQMPPIFRPELEQNQYSISILDYCARRVQGVPVSVLHTTYRMNQDITNVVSKNFYEPYGIHLISSDSAKGRTLDMPCLDSHRTESIVFVESTETENCEDFNPAEAMQAIKLAKSLLDNGMSPSDIAIVTPFRRQVRALREIAMDMLGDSMAIMIDTVERLQGLTVECIILSFSVSDSTYGSAYQEFILNLNRLNVMISRARTKVLFVCSRFVRAKLEAMLDSNTQIPVLTVQQNTEICSKKDSERAMLQRIEELCNKFQAHEIHIHIDHYHASGSVNIQEIKNVQNMDKPQ